MFSHSFSGKVTCQRFTCQLSPRNTADSQESAAVICLTLVEPKCFFVHILLQLKPFTSHMLLIWICLLARPPVLSAARVRENCFFMVALISHRFCPFLGCRLAGVNSRIEKEGGLSVAGRRQAAGNRARVGSRIWGLGRCGWRAEQAWFRLHPSRREGLSIREHVFVIGHRVEV